MYYHFWMHHVQSNDQLEGLTRMKIIILNKIFDTSEPTANTIKSSGLSCVQHSEYHQGPRYPGTPSSQTFKSVHNLQSSSFSMFVINPSHTASFRQAF